MPRFPAPTRRVILSNFRRKSTNTGQRIRRYSLATPGIIRAGQQCLTKLQQKMRNASLFNKGYEMSELLSAALLDMRWHCLEENEAMQDVDDFELRALVAENMDLPAITATLSQQLFRPYFWWRI
ncbi:dipeptidyl carboxypeptidase II [Escherichia coli]|nr:dipeptidyl carboxypeptidase II [Escherichia coli]